jgi:chromosome partitioning protein
VVDKGWSILVGARSATKGVKDRASQMYVERAYEVAAKHADLFDVENPADAFVITDDFMSAGRISGALSIPIPRLKVGQFHTVSGVAFRSTNRSCDIEKSLSI